MGLRGPPPKPRELRLLNGNAANRPLPDAIPVRRGAPPAPQGLSKRARAAWQRVGQDLERMGVLAHSDALALEQLVVAWDHWRTLERAVQREGWTQDVEDASGRMASKANPKVAMMEGAHTRLVRMLREFGLTPAARTRIRLDDQKAPPADELEQALGGVG